MVWDPHPSDPVSALSFEDPWLAAAVPGSAVLVNAEAALRGGRGSRSSGPRAAAGGPHTVAGSIRNAAPRRFAGAGTRVACVAVADHWLAYGGGA